MIHIAAAAAPVWKSGTSCLMEGGMMMVMEDGGGRFTAFRNSVIGKSSREIMEVQKTQC